MKKYMVLAICATMVLSSSAVEQEIDPEQIERTRKDIIAQCKTEYRSDELVIESLKRQIKEVQKDKKIFVSLWNSSVVNDIMITNKVVSGKTVIQKVERQPLPDRSKKIRRIIKFLKNKANNEAVVIYEKYSGKSAAHFLNEFESEYRAAQMGYEKVTKRLQELDEQEGAELDKIGVEHKAARGARLNETLQRLEECKAELDSTQSDYASLRQLLDEAKAKPASHDELSKLSAAIDNCSARIVDLKSEIAKLESNVETYREGAESSRELSSVASVRRSYDQKRHAVQSEYTHSVELKEIVDKYTIEIERNILDKMQRRIEILKEEIDAVERKQLARQAVINGDVELSNAVVAGYRQKKTEKILTILGIDEAHEWDEDWKAIKTIDEDYDIDDEDF